VTVAEYRIVVHEERMPARTEFLGPDGLVGSIESRLAVRGPEALVKDAAGEVRYEVGRPNGLTLRYELRAGGVVRATLVRAIFPLVNPCARVEFPDAAPWIVWKAIFGGPMRFSLSGTTVLESDGAVRNRGWRTSTLTAEATADGSVDPLLALALASLTLSGI
jgi:hypothetical protein